MTKLKSLLQLFVEFQRIPKEILIDRPNDLIETDFVLNHHVSIFISASIPTVFFTRRTLKHITEKGKEGIKLFELIPNTLLHPDYVHKTKKNNRWALSRSFLNKEMKRHLVVIIELLNGKRIIITVFISNEKYLKNFEILWRTAT